MIRHHLTTFQQKKQNTFEIDEKKLVKTFIYQNQEEWIQYFTGFLFMEPNQDGRVDLKIRFSRHPHLAELEASIRYPLQLFTDAQGLYTLIHEKQIKTVEKPQQNLLYLKMGHQNRIIAISFHNKGYCKALLEHLTLTLQNNDDTMQMTWIQQNLQFLNTEIKENLIYIDALFSFEEKITEFCGFFNKVDKKLYENMQKDTTTKEYKYMLQFFEIIKNLFLRANDKITLKFIEDKDKFETVLKCLSYNPFGVWYFNYLQQYTEETVVHDWLLDLQIEEFVSKYQLVRRIRFLRDVAICTFIEIPTEGVFNQLLAECYTKILIQFSLKNNDSLLEKIIQLSKTDEYHYLCIFTELWQTFKALIQDSFLSVLKQQFYLNWIQNGLFSQTLSAIGRLVKKREIADIHPRFWQKLLQAMNPMMSYQWEQTQKIILHHKAAVKEEQETTDLMNSLILILANCDSNTKSLILDFIRVQIQVSQNRKNISAKYLGQIYCTFIRDSYHYCCINQEDIEKYIQFLQKIYMAQPIRTRHFIVESNLFALNFKPFVQNKFIFIMLLKLLKTFIQIQDEDTFLYLSLGDFYDCVRQKYMVNKNLHNVTNSLFLSIFKSIQTMKNKEGKKYLYRVFFATELKIDLVEEKNNSFIKQKQKELFRSGKRAVPVTGFTNQMETQK